MKISKIIYLVEPKMERQLMFFKKISCIVTIIVIIFIESAYSFCIDLDNSLRVPLLSIEKSFGPNRPIGDLQHRVRKILPAREWLKRFEEKDSVLMQELRAIYNKNSSVVEERVNLYIKAVKTFVEKFPDLCDKGVFIIRVPARVNLRGMHVDNHGGAYNSVAIDRETICVIYPHGHDDQLPHNIILENTDPEFDRVMFEVTNEDNKPSNWGRYVHGSVLALKEKFPGKILLGLTGVVTSDIPEGAGLSSSHALVMCIIRAVELTNNLEIDSLTRIELARQAEGKAGAVTGLGDQGTMEFAREGRVLHTPFYQYDMEGIDPQYIPWPSGYKLIVVNSLRRRSLSSSETRKYAITRFAYSVALGLLQQAMRESGYKENEVVTIDRLSRVSPDLFALHGGTVAIYELLKKIPQKMSVEEIIIRHPSFEKTIERVEEKFLKPLGILERSIEVELRGVLIFGIAECMRSTKFFDCLREAYELEKIGKEQEKRLRIKEAGELMNIGHRGDSTLTQKFDDSYLNLLINRLQKNDKDSEAQLERLSGDFGASTKELDEIQDILVRNGAIGACLTGAGMGGVIIALVPDDEVERAKLAVAREYFRQPHDHFNYMSENPYDHIHVAFPIAGASILCVDLREKDYYYGNIKLKPGIQGIQRLNKNL